MVRAAADDVRFLLYIYHKMVQKLNDKSLWNLAVRGALYCRCFCINDNHFADWPPLPPIPGLFLPRLSLLTLKGKAGHIYICMVLLFCNTRFFFGYEMQGQIREGWKDIM